MVILKSNLILILLLISPTALPWGKTGHRIIGELAYRQLNFAVKKEVDKLLGKGQMPFASIWADEIKSLKSWDKARPWHYINIKKGQKIKEVPIDKNNIIWALFHFEDVLRSSKYGKVKKIQALKFLIHFYGDFHQPLHLAQLEDKGGNKVKVKFFLENTNLHSLWDEDMIAFQKLSFTEWANYIGKPSNTEKAKWVKGSILDWAQDLRANLKVMYELPNPVRFKYQYRHKKLLHKILRQGSYRLADALNRIFLVKPMNRKNKRLRRKILGRP